MRRRLILMRHAKSSWKVAGMADHDRPLNARGRRDAPKMAQALQTRGWAPEAVHSSDSTRTRETWARMAEVLAPTPASFHPTLYHGSLHDIRQVAATWPDHQAGPMLVLGHNPGWELAASVLGGERLVLTTANVVLLEGSGPTWAEAMHNGWTLVEHILPRALPD